MAIIQNPDGTWVMTDDSGQGLPPVYLPPTIAPTAQPQAPQPPPTPFALAPQPNMVEPGQQQSGPDPAYYIDPQTGVTIDLATMRPVSPSAAMIPSVRPAPARSQMLEQPGPLPAPPSAGELAVPDEWNSYAEAEGVLPTPPAPLSSPGQFSLGQEGGAGPGQPAMLEAGEPFAAPLRLSAGGSAQVGDLLNPLVVEKVPERSLITETEYAGTAGRKPGDVISSQSGPRIGAQPKPEAELVPGAFGGQVESLPSGARYTPPPSPRQGRTISETEFNALNPEIVTAWKEGDDDKTELTSDDVLKDPNKSLLATGIAQEIERQTGKPQYIGPTSAADVLKNWAIKKTSPLSSERKGQVHDALTGQAMAVAQGGDIAAKSFEDLALAEERKAADVRKQAAELQSRASAEQRKLREAINPINAELDAIRREAAVNPVERYYERKGAGARILGRISMAFMALGAGLTGDSGPMRILADQMRQEVEDEITFQKNKLDSMTVSVNAKRGLLADLRATMMSPEAAESGARALLLEANAAELRKMANLAQAPAARQAAIEAASALSVQAQGIMAEVEQKEGGEIALSGIHKPATSGGYSKQKSVLDVAAGVARKAGVHPLDVIQMWEDYTSGKPVTRPQGKTDRAAVQMMESAMERRVTLPSGDVLYTSRAADAKAVEAKINATDALRENLREIRGLVEQYGTYESLPTNSRARVDAMAAQNAIYIKPIIGEALSIGEHKEIWSHILGGKSTDFFSFATNNKARLDEGIRQTHIFSEVQLRTLHMDPWKHSPVSKIITSKPAGAKKIEK